MSAVGPHRGYVNAHTHLYSGLAPVGMPAPAPPPSSFLEILERVWWRLDRALDERSLRASARLYVAEALLCGTTTLVDHHESPSFIEGSLDVIADACHELGVRALLCYGATERNGGREEARRGLGECRRFARANRRPGVRGLVGLHASFTVSDETLDEAASLCRELGVAMHVHVAEDASDVEDARRRGNAGPLERLVAAGALPRASILAHGVHLGREQARRAESLGLWLVHNPRSNEGNGVGYAAALAASRRVALGTDGYRSDLREEMDALIRLARTGEPDTPRERLAGRLEGGHDLVAEHFGPAVEDGDTVEFRSGDPATGCPTMRRVVVGGQSVVEDGRLVAADLEAIRDEARREAARLWRRMEAS